MFLFCWFLLFLYDYNLVGEEYCGLLCEFNDVVGVCVVFVIFVLLLEYKLLDFLVMLVECFLDF